MFTTIFLTIFFVLFLYVCWYIRKLTKRIEKLEINTDRLERNNQDYYNWITLLETEVYNLKNKKS